MNRISFEDMAMSISNTVKERSEDPYKKVGVCILDRDGRVLSVGYNGLRSKHKEDKDFWLDRDHRRNYIIHAEANALSCISRHQNPYILASTLLPCSCCAMNIASYGIQKVIYSEDYLNDSLACKIFEFHNIELIRYESRD
jgi:dCMP deaminase